MSINADGTTIIYCSAAPPIVYGFDALIIVSKCEPLKVATKSACLPPAKLNVDSPNDELINLNGDVSFAVNAVTSGGVDESVVSIPITAG